MKRKYYTFTFSCLLVLFATGCANKTDSIDEKYYSKENFKTLQSLTASFGINLSNDKTLLLLIRDTECYPCLQELQYWNAQEKSFTKWNIRLFVVGKYSSSASSFLEREKITLTANIDTAYSFMRKDAVPQLPIKVLIAENQIKKIEPMGTGANLPSFTELMKD